MRVYFYIQLAFWVLANAIGISELINNQFYTQILENILNDFLLPTNAILFLTQFVSAWFLLFKKRNRTKIFKLYLLVSIIIVGAVTISIGNLINLYFMLMSVSYLISIFYLFMMYKMSVKREISLSETEVSKHINHN